MNPMKNLDNCENFPNNESSCSRKSTLKENRLGEMDIMKCGEIAVIIQYYDSQHIRVKFPNCLDDNKEPITKNSTYSNFIHRNISPIVKKNTPKPGRKSDNDIKERLNMTKTMNNGETAKIVAYRNARDIDVLFENGILVKNARYHEFVHGKMSSIRIRNKIERQTNH